jgi:hypothetical protein
MHSQPRFFWLLLVCDYVMAPQWVDCGPNQGQAASDCFEPHKADIETSAALLSTGRKGEAAEGQ